MYNELVNKLGDVIYRVLVFCSILFVHTSISVHFFWNYANILKGVLVKNNSY